MVEMNDDSFWHCPFFDGVVITDEYEDPYIHLPITKQLAKFREECELNQELELLNQRLELNFIPKS